jgi:cytochrome c oxidase cbb3-type subunit III
MINFPLSLRMTHFPRFLRHNFLFILPCLLSVATAQNPASAPHAASNSKSGTANAHKTYSAELVQKGNDLFRQNCSFCHGRDAGGGETGPDLTRSKLVTQDMNGDKISAVVREGRPDKGMPRFNLSEQEVASIVAFIHTQQNNAAAKKGGRKGVDVSDLQTGNADAGKQYFNGAGGCSSCHSPTGDLAKVASRYQGLQLEERLLYPRHAKSKVTVTLASGQNSGQTIPGTLEYLDEFTVGLFDDSGMYHSWRIGDVQYKVDAPVKAHIELLSKYTDDDIHNLMAYLQTLR